MLHLITTRKTNILSTVLVCGFFLMGAAFQYGGIKHDLVNTVTSSSSIILTNASTQVQRLTGSTAQAVHLPDARSLRVGYWYIVSNDSTQTASVYNYNSELQGTVSAGNSAPFYLTSLTTTGGPWDLQPGNGSSGGAAASGTMKAFWQGYHDDDCTFQVSTKDTQTQISDSTCTFVDSGPESTSFPTVSTSSDGGSTEYAGITFTTAVAGVYEVCAQYEVNLSDAGYVGMNMYDTTGGTRTANMNFRVVTANDSRAIRHCAFFTFAASVTPNIRIETYINGGSGTLSIGYSNGSFAGAFETIRWSIKVYEQ